MSVIYVNNVMLENNKLNCNNLFPTDVKYAEGRDLIWFDDPFVSLAPRTMSEPQKTLRFSNEC